MKKIIILMVLVVLVFVGCGAVNSESGRSQVSEDVSSSAVKTSSYQKPVFRGEKGFYVPLDEDGVMIESAAVEDGKAHFFNTMLANGDPVYFFIVKSPDGKLRAAANGCQVCGRALQGFRQEGDYMVCNTCGNSYPLNKIATEKGGCNPAPIDPDLEVEDGVITISVPELENIRQFFL